MTFFVVDILDSSNNVLGAGPLYTVISAELTTELDKAGQISVTVPATDARAIALLSTAAQIRIRNAAGVVGQGPIQRVTIGSNNDTPTYTFSGLDLLGELNWLSCGYNRMYDNANVETAIIGTTATATSLLGGTGWTAGTISIDASVATTSITFDGDTRLSALIALAAQIGHHFRQGTTARTLDFGTFGAASGIHIFNVDAVKAVQQDVTNNAYIANITLETVSSDIENRIIPLGKDKFDLRDADTALTDILVRTDQGPAGYATTTDDTTSGMTIPVTATTDGTRSFRVGDEVWIGDADDWTADHEYGIIDSVNAGVSIVLTAALDNVYAAGVDVIQRPQFYIEDTTSQASYGVREATPQFSWIGFSNTDVDAAYQIQAATSLYYAAKARLTRYKDPYAAYVLPDIFDVPISLKVGDTVSLRFLGIISATDTAPYVNVSGNYYVMKISRRWSGDGNGGALGITTLEVANVARPTPNNEALVIYNLDNNRWLGLRK
jgi:hypothetical protein